MKECIFVVSCFLTFAIILAFAVVDSKKSTTLKTTLKSLKIYRNLCAIISLSAFVASICLPSFSFKYIFFPIAIVPISLVSSIQFHKYMLIAKKLEIRMEEYQKTQPIDVEFRELN